MGIDDRNWLRHDRKRRPKLVWNDKSGEMEFDRAPPKRRWRWPYRLRPDLPWWAREVLRYTILWGLAALVYVAWKRLS